MLHSCWKRTFNNSSSNTAGVLNFGGLISAGATATLSLTGANAGSNTISGTIANGTSIAAGAVMSLTENATGGLWVLSGNNSFSGATTLTAGTLQLGNQ